MGSGVGLPGRGFREGEGRAFLQEGGFFHSCFQYWEWGLRRKYRSYDSSREGVFILQTDDTAKLVTRPVHSCFEEPDYQQGFEGARMTHTVITHRAAIPPRRRHILAMDEFIFPTFYPTLTHFCTSL